MVSVVFDFQLLKAEVDSLILLLLSEVVKKKFTDFGSFFRRAEMYSVFANLMAIKGVKSADVSKATGIRESVFSDWKSGRSSPKQDKLLKIADYFGVSVDYLLTGKDTEKTSIGGNTYCFSDETAEIATLIYQNKDLKLLFKIAIKSKSEDIQMASDMLKRLLAYQKSVTRIYKNAQQKASITSSDEEELRAAHERTDIETTDEMKQHDYDIMKGDDF